jgi:hypothetical protein
MSDNPPPIPDISRLFIGAVSEFEVKTVFVKKRCGFAGRITPF